jgi:hypothetical protein
MKKALIVGAAVALVGVSVLVYSAVAQQGPGSARWRPSAEDIGAFASARIAALKAGLALTAEQERLWGPVEEALRDNAKRRVERWQKFRADRESQTGPADPVTRLRRGSEYMGERSAEMKRLADALQPLYEKLDDAQKRRFQILSRLGMRDRAMRWRDRAERREDWRGWRRHGDDMRGPGDTPGMGRRFGWRDHEGPRGPGMGHRFGRRDDDGPRGPGMGHRFGQRHHQDDRLGLRFGEPEERL